MYYQRRCNLPPTTSFVVTRAIESHEIRKGALIHLPTSHPKYRLIGFVAREIEEVWWESLQVFGSITHHGFSNVPATLSWDVSSDGWMLRIDSEKLQRRWRERRARYLQEDLLNMRITLGVVMDYIVVRR